MLLTAMAIARTARAPAPAETAKPRRSTTRARPLVAFAAAVAIGLAILAFFGHAFLNYDTFYALVWGKQIAHGITPEYKVPVAPTPHPLAILVGVVLSTFGDAAEPIALGIVLLAIGLMCMALYRLGSELFAWPVGLVAAAIAATRVPLLNYGIRGYVDLPVIALILWAAVLEARRPRRGASVLALLTLAGLLRPEAWLFSAAYWLWVAPARDWNGRLRLAALAAVAPVAWALSDLAITGDPLWSLHGTHDLAARLGRRTGLGSVPSVLPRRLGEILRLPELIASVVGFVAGLVWLRRRTLLPAAIAVLNGLAFLAFAAARLPLLGRYLFLAGSVLSLFAAIAVFGWMRLPPAHPARAPWRIVGLVTLAGMLAFTPSQAHRLRALRADIAHRERVQADLHKLVERPAVGAAIRRCGPAFTPNHGQVPLVAYWSDLRPSDVKSVEYERAGRTGVYLSPASRYVAGLAVLDPRDPRRFAPPAPGAGPPQHIAIARDRSWVAYACG